MNRRRVNRIVNVTAGVLVLASAAILPWYYRGLGHTQHMLGQWWDGCSAEATAGLRRFDPVFLEAAPDGGNVAIRFANFDPGDPEHRTLFSHVYFQGAYGFYPRRLIAAEPGAVAQPAEVLKQPFSPTLDQLHQSDVRAVVLFTMLPDGQMNISTVRVPAPAGGR